MRQIVAAGEKFLTGDYVRVYWAQLHPTDTPTAAVRAARSWARARGGFFLGGGAMRQFLAGLLVAAGMSGPGQSEAAIVVHGIVAQAQFDLTVPLAVTEPFAAPGDAMQVIVLGYNTLAQLGFGPTAVPTPLYCILTVGTATWNLELMPPALPSLQTPPWGLGLLVNPVIGGHFMWDSYRHLAVQWSVWGTVTAVTENAPEPTPEPASAAVWLCLVGLAVAVRRRTTPACHSSSDLCG